LAKCKRGLDASGQPAPLEPAVVHVLLEEMASQGLRVLAFARGEMPADASAIGHDDIANLTYLGLQGMIDPPRPEAIDAVRACQSAGIRIKMITGDHPITARAIAEQVGIGQVEARVQPDRKAERIRKIQQEGKRVAMVGDGINDAPALAQADRGIAIGTGTDVAIESSDITLLSDDLGGVATAIRLSRRTFRTILQNLGWAFGYNTAAIPLAAAGLLNPIIAGGAMAFSSVSVVLNSIRLYRFKR